MSKVIEDNMRAWNELTEEEKIKMMNIIISEIGKEYVDSLGDEEEA